MGLKLSTENMIKAADAGNLKIVKRCVAKGLDVNEFPRYHQQCNALMSAAWENRVEVVRYLLANGARDVRNSENVNAVTIAARHGALESMELLLEADFSYRCVSRTCHESVADEIAQSGRVDVMALLMRPGAKWNRHGTMDLKVKAHDRGDLPIVYAASRGHVEMVRYLVEQHGCVVPPAITNSMAFASGYNFSKFTEGCREVLRYLRTTNYDFNAPDSDGNNPLFYAMSVQYQRDKTALTPFIRAIVEETGCAMNIKTKGYTPIHLAGQASLEAFVYILDHGGDPTINSDKGDNMRALALEYGRNDVVDELIQRGL